MKKEMKNEIHPEKDEERYAPSQGKMFAGAAAVIGLASIGWAIVCFCGGPDGAAGSPASIKAGLIFSGIGVGLLYYSFK